MQQKIPFEIAVDPFYSTSNTRYLEKKMADYKVGKLQFTEHEPADDPSNFEFFKFYYSSF